MNQPVAAGLLSNKNILVTGVLTDDSLAFGVAREAQAQGAHVILTGFGRGKRLTQRTARKLDPVPEVLELDVTDPDQVISLIAELKDTVGELHGILHAVGFAPEACLGDDLFAATWDDVATAVHVSTYSLRTIADIGLELMPSGGSIVGLTFDATVAWPAYNWMGVAKAGMESLNRYLAKELGPKKIRCNLVAAGPMRTIAAKSIPGFAQFEDEWTKRAPLGWDVNDSSGVARSTMALFTDLFSHTTGSIIHVDGGYHAIGA
ncbi:MAG: enoyl-ACP reductase FabI [Acidimicrobiia bacterium]|nr:enoyl-ACP reductase FabI [Acidimicrobiia bacterium]